MKSPDDHFSALNKEYINTPPEIPSAMTNAINISCMSSSSLY
ncbi:MAG: hypothetical protein WCC55_01070 [Nitrosotalea sp.]